MPGRDTELDEAGSLAPGRSLRGAQVALVLAWSVVIVLQTRAMLEWAMAAMVSGDGDGARTLLVTSLAGTVVVAVAGSQRAHGGHADLGTGSLRFLAGVARAVMVIVLLFVAWCAVWALGDPSAMPGLLAVLATVVPSIAALVALGRLRAEPAGTRAVARVVGGLVGVSAVPVLVAGVLVGVVAGLTS
jgi:hypothetical protein